MNELAHEAEPTADPDMAMHLKHSKLIDHPFVPDSDPTRAKWCAGWMGPVMSGKAETGIITMRVGCGYLEKYHEKEGE